MEKCKAVTSSPHLFAFSYRLFKKCFDEKYEFKIAYLSYFLSDLHHILTVLFEMFYSFYSINSDLDWISPLTFSLDIKCAPEIILFVNNHPFQASDVDKRDEPSRSTVCITSASTLSVNRNLSLLQSDIH